MSYENNLELEYDIYMVVGQALSGITPEDLKAGFSDADPKEFEECLTILQHSNQVVLKEGKYYFQ